MYYYNNWSCDKDAFKLFEIYKYFYKSQVNYFVFKQVIQNTQGFIILTIIKQMKWLFTIWKCTIKP